MSRESEGPGPLEPGSDPMSEPLAADGARSDQQPATGAARPTRRPRATADGAGNGHDLEAPHRRQARGGRRRERLVVLAYRALAWLVAHVRPGLAWRVGSGLAMVGYVLAGRQRRWARANFGHVLGVPPSDPAAGRLARAAFRTYARYTVELLRLPSLSREEAADLVELEGAEVVAEYLHGTPGGLIVVVAHLANNEAAAAGLALHGLPVSAVADDTAYGELFDLLRRQREGWGVRIIPWRNLREVYGVLRRGEILGLLVDWGYRPDGIPVRLFGAWTALPAGPAVLAARNRSTILPVFVRRLPDGRFSVRPDLPITVASTDPAELARATQSIADALERAVAAAPEQWYIFKPIWPETADEEARLERLAASHGHPAVSPQPSGG